MQLRVELLENTIGTLMLDVQSLSQAYVFVLLDAYRV